MKALWISCLSAVTLMAQIQISDAQMKKMGITVTSLKKADQSLLGPFVARIDFDEEKSKSYFLDHEAAVISVHARAGDSVRKGDVLCRIASPDLAAASIQLDELKNRYVIARNNMKKDESLYQEGIIAQRVYQNSQMEASLLQAQINAIQTRLRLSGVSASQNGSMSVIAQKSGIVTMSPLNVAEKIEPYKPFFRISDTNAKIAVFNIPPRMVDALAKGDNVIDKEGNRIGKVMSISPSLNTNTNSANVTAKIESSKNTLRSGTTAGLYISASKPLKAVLVPANAIIKHKGKAICFIKTPQGFQPQQLAIVSTSKEGSIVNQKGLNGDTKVAVSGLVVLKGAMSGLGFE